MHLYIKLDKWGKKYTCIGQCRDGPGLCILSWTSELGSPHRPSMDRGNHLKHLILIFKFNTEHPNMNLLCQSLCEGHYIISIFSSPAPSACMCSWMIWFMDDLAHRAHMIITYLHWRQSQRKYKAELCNFFGGESFTKLVLIGFAIVNGWANCAGLSWLRCSSVFFIAASSTQCNVFAKSTYKLFTAERGEIFLTIKTIAHFT